MTTDYAVIVARDDVDVNGKKQVIYHTYMADLNSRTMVTLSDISGPDTIDSLETSIRAEVETELDITLDPSQDLISAVQNFYLDEDGIVLAFDAGTLLPAEKGGVAVRVDLDDANLSMDLTQLPTVNDEVAIFDTVVNFPPVPDTTPTPAPELETRGPHGKPCGPFFIGRGCMPAVLTKPGVRPIPPVSTGCGAYGSSCVMAALSTRSRSSISLRWSSGSSSSPRLRVRVPIGVAVSDI